MPFFSIRKQGYNRMQGTSVNLQQHRLVADADHTSSEHTELLLLVRPPLHSLVTDKEQNTTQPPIQVKKQKISSLCM
jgi:hypothetical protein